MYIRSLIPRNFADLSEADPIGSAVCHCGISLSYSLAFMKYESRKAYNMYNALLQ